MLLQVILEGLGLGALLVLVCAVGIRKGAVGMVHLYSPEVQERCITLGLTTHEKIKRNSLLFKAVCIPGYIGYVLVCVYGINGAKGFVQGFWQLLVILSVMNLMDRLLVDGYWVGHTNAWTIPGTEDLKPYITAKDKQKKWLFGTVGMAVIAMVLAVLAQKFYAGIDSFTLLCIPGFMLAGALMNGGGITRRILNFCNAFLGHFTGSLALVNIVASMVFAGISGTAIADVCSLGGMLIPAMVEDGYDDDFSVAVTAASSVVGPIIPPSVPMVIAGSCVSISVGKMFQAGIIPGVLLGLALCVPTYIISVKRHYPRHERSSWKKRLEVTKDAIWALLMPVILLGGILSGIFTPTEASIVTCVYSLIVGVFVYKEIKLSDVPRIVYTNMRSCSSIIILIGLANVFAFILTNERIPQKVATAILSMTTNRILVILLINLVLIFVGMFMESLAAILITFPVLLPVATAVGMNPVHFALMAILNLMIGLTTPPVGMCICTGAQIGGVSSWKAFKANMPFLITSLIVLMLVSFCEPITLWIPSLFA